MFLAKLCVKFVNNCRVCSSHVGNQGNHCRRQESDPISPSPAKSPLLLRINSSYFWPTLKFTPALRRLPPVLLLITGALVLLEFYRGFITQQKVGLQIIKRFSTLLVEFSVSFRVIVVEQMLDAHSSQPLSTFADGEGRRYRLRTGRPASAQARYNCPSPSISTRPTTSQEVAVGIQAWYDHVV